MKTAWLIRHAATAGNLAKRYIGRTDEPLCAAGRAQARARAAAAPDVDLLFCSPLRRCRQTAALLFPAQAQHIVDGLRECDFGLFENRTAVEMENDPAYCAWVAGDCAGAIPGGESVAGFQARCCAAFAATLRLVPEGNAAAFVIHGGCIMAILARYAVPRRPFYSYRVENCGLIACRCDGLRLTVAEGAPC